MAITLGPNRYGKAEIRLAHVDRTERRASGRLGRRLNIDLDLNVANSPHRRESRMRLVADLACNRGLRRGQHELSGNIPALDPDLPDQAEGHDVSRKSRVSHLPQGVTEGLFIER